MMTLRFLPLAGLVALTACGVNITDLRPEFPTTGPAPAPVAVVPPPPNPMPIMTAKERLVSAIEAQGCELNASNVTAVLTAATISSDELKDLIPQLQTEGRVEVKNGGAIRVISPQCI